MLDIDDNPATKSQTMAGYDKSRIQRLKYHYQAKKIPAMVEKTLDKVFCSFYASLIEPPSPKSVYLHNTVVTPAAVPDTRAGASKRILCVGSLFFKPNKNGFCHFANNILPLVRQQIPDVELRIAGNISPKMSEILNAIDGVEAIGFADDLAAEYEAAGVVAIPIYEGSGTCVKFAEAMLMNRPIVSTPVGARGFDEIAKDGVHYLQAKSDEEFAAKTVELLLNAEKAGALTAAAMKTAKENLSEEKFFETVRISIEERLATSSPSI